MYLAKRRLLKGTFYQAKWWEKTNYLQLEEHAPFWWLQHPTRMAAAGIMAWTANQKRASSLKSAVKMGSTFAVRALKVNGNNSV